jgi:hypothetical protein
MQLETPLVERKRGLRDMLVLTQYEHWSVLLVTPTPCPNCGVHLDNTLTTLNS